MASYRAAMSSCRKSSALLRPAASRAFLCFSSEETQALYDELLEAAGDSYDYPRFDELDLDVSPEAEQAARFLVDLMTQ